MRCVNGCLNGWLLRQLSYRGRVSVLNNLCLGSVALDVGFEPTEALGNKKSRSTLPVQEEGQGLMDSKNVAFRLTSCGPTVSLSKNCVYPGRGHTSSYST